MAAQYHFCPTHSRLCEVGSPRSETPAEATWRHYQAAVGQIIKEQHEERELLLLWLGIVEATHRDVATTIYLEDTIRLGNWSMRLIAQARALATWAEAEMLP